MRETERELQVAVSAWVLWGVKVRHCLEGLSEGANVESKEAVPKAEEQGNGPTALVMWTW